LVPPRRVAQLAALPTEVLLDSFGSVVDLLAGRVDPAVLRDVVAPIACLAELVSDEHALPEGWHPPLTLPNLPIVPTDPHPPPAAFVRLQERLCKRLHMDTSQYHTFSSALNVALDSRAPGPPTLMDVDPTVSQGPPPSAPAQGSLIEPQLQALVKHVAQETAVCHTGKIPMPATYTESSKILPITILADVYRYCTILDLYPVSIFPSFLAGSIRQL
jgi:hypothetical protein